MSEASVGPETVPDQARVLVIEDEPGIVYFVRRGLESAGFRVQSASDGLEGESLALEEDFDVIVLDLMLPNRDGMEVLAGLRRAKPHVPVIVLTARREVEDRVAALNAGALDYLVKPFAMAELTARVRAQARAATNKATTLVCEGIEADLLARQVRRDGKAIPLSSKEFDLLVFLIRHRGAILSRERILAGVWGYQHDPQTNVVDVYIGYLRRKLSHAGSPAPILTVHGVGYRFGSEA